MNVFCKHLFFFSLNVLVNSLLVNTLFTRLNLIFLPPSPLQVDTQRVDPLGSWMDFVKRPVDNLPGKCRKRKRPLVTIIATAFLVSPLKHFIFLMLLFGFLHKQVR